MKHDPVFKYFSVSLIWMWLIVFALIPFVLVFITSLLHRDTLHLVQLPLTLSNYTRLINATYLKIFLDSIEIASATTFLCLMIGYPFAYLIAQNKSRHKLLLLVLVIIPFWTSSLIRTYAIMAILKAKGILNSLLLALGIIHQPLQILYSNLAVFIGLVYDLLPFMILPLYANIEKLDTTLIDAARDLGAHRPTIFFRIILPLTLPGILAGIILVFLPAMTLFFVPVILGSSKDLLLGNLIQSQFLLINDWPTGSATSILLMIIMGILLLLYWRHSKHEDRQELL